MPDITMCSGLGCDLKHDCYRHTSERSYLQSFFTEIPIKDGKCEMFWDNELKRNKKENNGK